MSVRLARRATMQGHVIPVTTGGLAMPKGPTISDNSAFKTSGFAQACDFYDSVGVNHHASYLNSTTDVTAAVSVLSELGIRHIRHGLASVATEPNEGTIWWAFIQAVKNHPSWNAYFLFDTPYEPEFCARVNTAVYRIGLPSDSNPDDTLFRQLDGRTGAVSQTNWPAGSPYYPNELKYYAGTFNDVGWEMAAGLQGPNEPDNVNLGLRKTPNNVTYYDSIRNEVHARLKVAKNGRPTEQILGGADYVDSTTGRIETGPAFAPQLPVYASPISVSFDNTEWALYGDYTLTGETDIASKHTYPGTQPKYRGMWEKSTLTAISSGKGWPGETSDRYAKQAYNGRLTPGGIYSSELPYAVTEEGWSQSGVNMTPPEIVGEYLIRMYVHNYLGGAKRTYMFSLNDISDQNFLSGLCTVNWTKRASFYAVKNLLEIVGFVQGFTSQPITVTNNFTSSNNEHNVWGNGGAAGDWTFDGLRQLTLQRDDCHLVILVRDRVLWDIRNHTRMTVADPKTVTVSVPPGMFTSASRAIPSLNTVATTNGTDGVDYSWSLDPGGTDGTAWRSWTSGEVGGALAFNGTSFTTSMAGLTQVFRMTP